MTDDELQQLVEKVSLRSFHRPFRHRAIFNHRLRTTGGRYMLHDHHLEFNVRQLEHFGMAEFIKIIKHELCHYHLHLAGNGYKHRDQAFKHLLSQVGGSRYCGAIPGTSNRSLVRYVYQCEHCRQQYIRGRRLDTKKYVCGKCSGKLHLIEGEKIE